MPKGLIGGMAIHITFGLISIHYNVITAHVYHVSHGSVSARVGQAHRNVPLLTHVSTRWQNTRILLPVSLHTHLGAHPFFCRGYEREDFEAKDVDHCRGEGGWLPGWLVSCFTRRRVNLEKKQQVDSRQLPFKKVGMARLTPSRDVMNKEASRWANEKFSVCVLGVVCIYVCLFVCI